MGLYQVSSNNSPGVKFDLTLGVTSFTWDYIGKTLENSLYLTKWLRLTKFCMLLYLLRVPKVQPGGHKFYMGLYRKKLPNLPVPSHKAKAYQILHVALSSEPLP